MIVQTGAEDIRLLSCLVQSAVSLEEDRHYLDPQQSSSDSSAAAQAADTADHDYASTLADDFRQLDCNSDDAESELHDSHSPLDLLSKIEVGDVVEIVNLQTQQGKQMNGYYAKVVQWSESSKRFGVDFRGRSFALKPENLRMGMKVDEMSNTDEEMLLNLEPTTADIQALPWKERMQRLGY